MGGAIVLPVFDQRLRVRRGCSPAIARSASSHGISDLLIPYRTISIDTGVNLDRVVDLLGKFEIASKIIPCSLLSQPGPPIPTFQCTNPKRSKSRDQISDNPHCEK